MVSKNQILLISLLAFASSWQFFSHLQFSPQSQAAADSDFSMQRISSRTLKVQNESAAIPVLSNRPLQTQNKSAGSPQLENICLLRELDSPFRPNSEDQYLAIRSPSEDSVLILIKSPLCPDGSHSVVSASRSEGRWSLEKSLDCRHTSPTEIYQNYRPSGKLTFLGKSTEQMNLALNVTSADFLTLCDRGFVASRLGNFKIDEFELYRDQHGCLLMTQTMEPFRKGNSLGEIALIETWSDKQQQREFIEPGRVAVTLNSADIPLLSPAEDSFLEGYYESYDRQGVSPLGIPNDAFISVNFDQDCSF